METRRLIPLFALLAAWAALPLSAAPRTLKISHQFPGGTPEQGDFRDRLCRQFAAAVERQSGGELKFEIYRNSSLLKTNAQYSAMRKGALDLALIPLPYAAGEIPSSTSGSCRASSAITLRPRSGATRRSAANSRGSWPTRAS
jgi:TRAP-type C4-dicarboxylate transport system substrate-binding protein